MQFFKYNRTVAVIALVITVALCIPLGVIRSVTSLKVRVEDSFTDTQAQSDLKKYATHAENFIAAYEAFCGSDPDLREALSAYRDVIGTPFLMTDEMETLSSMAANAYYKASLITDEGDETLKNSLIAYYYEMQSDEMRLANNEDYANRANAYNRAIDAFPASVLCPGRTPAILFG
ncbi:MAG: hypothetical protein IJZ08_03160 [Clostridia bacterium]|nr:hypothetical protein [Clostridia bacterium]